MKNNYYNRSKLTAIIMDLIYLEDKMNRDGHTDKKTLKGIKQTIDDLKYYLQFIK